MGIIDIDSVPPATMTSAPPLMMRSAAIAIDCSPEEQKRLIVSAETSTGKPARREAMRATFRSDDFRATAHDALGGHRDRLQSRGAEAVDSERRDFDGQARAQGGYAGDVQI